MMCQKKHGIGNLLIVNDMSSRPKCGIVWKSVECVEGNVE